MPFFFSSVMYNVLQRCKLVDVFPGERLFGFLNDLCNLYALSTREKCRNRYDLLADRLFHRVVIELVKVPESTKELGPNVSNPKGLKSVGDFCGDARSHHAASEECLHKEEFWRTIPWVRDLQCAWQFMLQCAGPRCHHYLRTVPPSLSAACTAGHDSGMQQVMNGLLEGLPGDQRQQEVARMIASLSMRTGSLGIRSATSMAPAAYWAHCSCSKPDCPANKDQVVQGPDQRGQSGVREPDQHQSLHLSLSSGSMAGSTTRPLPLNSTFGRAWYLPSLLPLTRLICDRTQAKERARSCA